MYIKGIHITVADAISWLDYGPVKDDRSTWMTFAQYWWYHNSTQQHEASIANSKESMNLVFANQNKEDAIYPLTTREIAEAWQQDNNLKIEAAKEGYSTHLVKNIEVLCKQGKMVLPKCLQHHTVAWFHHYLQHPGTKLSKKLFVFQCIGKVSEQQSNHMSKNVTVARWINTDNSNMANCQQNLQSPTPGRQYVWIS